MRAAEAPPPARHIFLSRLLASGKAEIEERSKRPELGLKALELLEKIALNSLDGGLKHMTCDTLAVQGGGLLGECGLPTQAGLRHQPGQLRYAAGGAAGLARRRKVS